MRCSSLKDTEHEELLQVRWEFRRGTVLDRINVNQHGYLACLIGWQFLTLLQINANTYIFNHSHEDYKSLHTIEGASLVIQQQR